MRCTPFALALLLGAAAAQAQVPPDADWRTLESRHFRITFAPGLDALAAHAAGRAEAAYARLAATLASAPRGKVDILLTDFVDASNGSATPFPSNRIVVYARPPVDVPDLAYFEDWIELVVTHELAHVFHLDGTGALGSVLRTLFGRVPLPWPLFPAISTPQWSIEGLATYIESAHTGEGRVHGTYHDMVLRTAALEGAFDPIDRVTGAGPRWPGGAKSYIYGSMFADHLARTHGPEVQKALAARTARAWIPPFLSFDRLSKKATGRSYSDAYAAWRAELEAAYARLADSLRAQGLTAAERLTAEGYAAEHPRVAPDGRVAYAASDGRNPAATRILDPATGRIRDLARRNGLDAIAWLPDGSILTAQLERDGPYRVYGDLYLVDPDGAERRLTRGARLTGADVTRDGRRVVAVQTAPAGATRLALYHLASGDLRPLTPEAPDVHWAFPRWAPAGDRIAAGRWRRGEYDVVVLDTAGAVLHELTRDRAVDAMPAWSADGRYVLFSSDRSGIPNLYAYDLAPGVADSLRLRQVTSVLTGAFYPDASPDGRWIYFSGYHADGLHIERIPFDPPSWRDPSPLRAALLVAERAAPDPGADAADRTDRDPTGGERGAAAGGAVRGSARDPAAEMQAAAPGAAQARIRPYSPWRTLLPRAWLPVVYGEGGTFIGATTGGHDLVGRHGYSLAAAYNADRRVFDGALTYEYAGLGNPVLSLDLWRAWDDIPVGERPPEAPELAFMSREDGLALAATLLRRRFRSDALLTIGAERIVERRRLFDAPGFRVAYPGTTFHGVFAGAAFANYQTHPFSISREDGVALALRGARLLDREPFTYADGAVVDRSYDEVTGAAAVYHAFPVFGFADHVLALRLAGRLRTGAGAEPFDLGGASAPGAHAFGRTIGGSGTPLPVRAYGEGVRVGTRGWSASLEYRFPLALIDRGHRLWPVYLDRLSAAAFLDAGDAWCTDAEIARRPWCPGAALDPVLGAGAELALDANLFFGARIRVRAGVAVPLRREPGSDSASGYILLGPNF